MFHDWKECRGEPLLSFFGAVLVGSLSNESRDSMWFQYSVLRSILGWFQRKERGRKGEKISGKQE